MLRRFSLAFGAIGLIAFAATHAAAQERPAIGDTITTPSGLRYFFTQQGSGPRPDSGDVIVIHGIGRLLDGTEFWNTRTDGSPYEYTPGVDRVIAGFREGMRFAREGDRIVFIMKPELAYGERGRTGIPPNSTLVFDYEILEVAKLSIARLLRDGFATDGVDATLERARRLPNLRDYHTSESAIASSARSAGRSNAAHSEKVLLFGISLLPESYRLHQALGRAQAERGATADAIRSYEAAQRFNPRRTDADNGAYEAAATAIAELRAR